MKTKVLIADKLPEPYVEKIKLVAGDVRSEAKITEESLVNEIKDAEILIVRSTVVKEQAINKSKNLSLIIRAGAGVNNIDIKAANKKGIYVANCPGQNSIAVAELAMGLICAIDRKIPDNVIDFRNGKWNKSFYSKSDGLYGKTLGIVGTGKIGTELIFRAQSFGLNIIAWSRSLTEKKSKELGIIKMNSLDELFSKSDIVSIHLAQNSETKGLISKNLIGKLKEGAYFINTSRAGIVDEEALIAAAKDGKVFLGLDVFKNEPEIKEGEFKSTLTSLPNVYVTHHIGASTNQAQNAVAEEAVAIIDDYLNLGIVRNWVNRCEKTDAKFQLVVRHFDKPGVLAKVLDALSKEDINAQEIENVIFDGKHTACCRIKLDSQPSESLIKNLSASEDDVLSVSLIEL
jgi:D-3-phosphoglycerate dehydrogenase / 2-oxoglutarate reductase